MKKWFDPWPVFFRREFNRNWPFLVGFAVTGALITKMTMGLTEEDAKNSKFVQRHKRRILGSSITSLALGAGKVVGLFCFHLL